MVREEYLNPEFMYRIMNSLCKKDGYVLQHFTFGQLTYLQNHTPVLLTDNHGYSVVYKMVLGKFSEEQYNKLQAQEIINPYDINKLFEQKTVYFDIFNELLLDDEMLKGSFMEFPPFFTLGGQIYYAIYNQPKVLKEHYSRGRDEGIFQDYCNYMGIDEKNIFSPTDIIANHRSPQDFGLKYREKLADLPDIHRLLTKTERSCFSQWWKSVGYGRYKPSAYCKEFPFWKLPIHESQFPVFYTANVLELTVPIVEVLNQIVSRVDRALNGIERVLGHVIFNMRLMMIDHMDHVYNYVYDKTKRDNEKLLAQGIDRTYLKKPHEEALAERNKLEHVAEDRFSTMKESLSAAHQSIEQVYMSDKLSKLLNDVRKLTADNISLDRILEIENNLIMLVKKEE